MSKRGNTQSSTTRISSRSISRTIVTLDPKFKEVVSLQGPSTVGMERSRKTNFQSLSHSILSQQLSTKAAATITSRVTDLAGGRLTPESVVRLSESKLRGAGCSHAKSRALQELAEASLDQRVPMKKLHLMSDGEIFDALLPLFGIGRWTVEMFLIFQLGRSDVWPVGDLGVRRGWERIHKMKDDITPELLFKRGEKFAPYRSHVAWFCWRALDL